MSDKKKETPLSTEELSYLLEACSQANKELMVGSDHVLKLSSIIRNLTAKIEKLQKHQDYLNAQVQRRIMGEAILVQRLNELTGHKKISKFKQFLLRRIYGRVTNKTTT